MRFKREQAKKHNVIEEKKSWLLFLLLSIKLKNTPNTKNIGNNAVKPAIAMLGFSKLLKTSANAMPDWPYARALNIECSVTGSFSNISRKNGEINFKTL